MKSKGICMGSKCLPYPSYNVIIMFTMRFQQKIKKRQMHAKNLTAWSHIILMDHNKKLLNLDII